MVNKEDLHDTVGHGLHRIHFLCSNSDLNKELKYFSERSASWKYKWQFGDDYCP
jgi:hypothetical protein